MATGDPVVIEAALNGNRDRSLGVPVPWTPEEVAAEARRCGDAGACIVHIHARTADGGWSAAPNWYTDAIRLIHDHAPEILIGTTSIRPAGVPVAVIEDLLAALAVDPATVPDLVSVNLGHIVVWEAASTSRPIRRRTSHFPNDYEDIVAILAACNRHDIAPELGVMDLGFVSNAAALRVDGKLPTPAWFLIELDSPGYGAGRQIAPSTRADYDVLAARLREHLPGARWAAHGVDVAGYDVLRRAIDHGAHLRVGFEDAVHLPDGRLAASNAELVDWAVETARERGRAPATPSQARELVRGKPAR